MRRRQAYAVKQVQEAEPLPRGYALCPYCHKQFTTRGIYHHKIKCKKG